MLAILERLRRIEDKLTPVYGAASPPQMTRTVIAQQIIDKIGDMHHRFSKQNPTQKIEVDKKIGSGSFGDIYVLKNDPAKVVKIVRVNIEQFCQEAAINVVLGNHGVGVAAFEDDFKYGKLDIKYSTVVERVPLGGALVFEKYDADLSTYFRTHPDAIQHILKINRKLSENIDRLYEFGITCSDIKPQNVLVKYTREEILEIRISDYDSNFCCLHTESGDVFPHCSINRDWLEIAKNATKMQLSLTTYLYSSFSDPPLGKVWTRMQNLVNVETVKDVGPEMYNAFTQEHGEPQNWPTSLSLVSVPKFVHTIQNMTNHTIVKSGREYFRARKTPPVILLDACQKFFDQLKERPQAIKTLEQMNVLKTFAHYVFDTKLKLSDFESTQISKALADFMEEIGQGEQHQKALQLRSIVNKWQTQTMQTRRKENNVSEFVENLKTLVNSGSTPVTSDKSAKAASDLLFSIAYRVKDRRRNARASLEPSRH